MSTKENVLALLKENGTLFLSGQEIADKLFVTRASVWKAIKALQKDGFEIDAVTNKGYRLKEKLLLPSSEEIKTEIKKLMSDKDSTLPLQKIFDNILVFESVESTNDTAGEYARENPGKEALILAGCQTKGRGRRGRSFYSPSNTGIYMSLLIYPHSDFKEAVKITCIMAVAVCQAIEKVIEITPSIKWVNDIFLNGLKVGGILTEGISCIEDGELSHVIIGLGLNLYAPYEGFPKDIQKTAGALLQSTADKATKARLIAATVLNFMELYKSEDKNAFVEKYRNLSMLIGSYVKINEYKNDEKSSKGYALVKGIDDNCHLVIEYDDGTLATLSSGEVSVVKY